MRYTAEQVRRRGAGLDAEIRGMLAAFAATLDAQADATPLPPYASVPDGFLAHVRDVCFAAEALCQPRPRRNFEDSIEHDGAACLAGLTRIANDIDRMIVATPQAAGAPIDALTKALAQAHARSVAAEAKAAEYEARDAEFDAEMKLDAFGDPTT